MSHYLRLSFFLAFLLLSQWVQAQLPRGLSRDSEQKREFTPRTLIAFEKMSRREPISEVKAEGEATASLKIFANPFKSSIELEFEKEVKKVGVIIYNQKGDVRFRANDKQFLVQRQLDQKMRFLPSDTYVMKVITADKIYRQVFIIQKDDDPAKKSDRKLSSSQ